MKPQKDSRRDFWCQVYAASLTNAEPTREPGAASADYALAEYDRRWTPCDECEGKGAVCVVEDNVGTWIRCGVCNGTGYAPGEEKSEGGAT